MWSVCAYYTKRLLYEEYAKKLEESLKLFNVSYDIVQVEEQGDWYKNTQYKPVFLKQMLKKHYPNSIVYVDVDAIFCQHPGFFDKLDRESDVNIAVHVLDHSKYRRKTLAPELLSGTIFLKNTKITNQIIDKWIHGCKKSERMWDQRALADVLREYKYHLLPEEYCMIYDYMSSIKHPVIKHFQASRESRKGTVVKKNKNVSTSKKVVKNRRISRRVVRNGIVCIKRKK